jgi:hypothetical protein
MAVLAVWLAFYLRIDQVGAPVSDQGYVYGLAIVLFVPIFVRMGLYRAIFRYAGMPAVWPLLPVLIYGIFFCDFALDALGWGAAQHWPDPADPVPAVGRGLAYSCALLAVWGE